MRQPQRGLGQGGAGKDAGGRNAPQQGGYDVEFARFPQHGFPFFRLRVFTSRNNSYKVGAENERFLILA